MSDSDERFQKPTGKVDFTLLPFDALAEAAEAMAAGLVKYDRDNWRCAPDPNVYLQSALRHLAAEVEYTRNDAVRHKDEDSGELSIAHAVASLLIYLELTRD